MTDQDRGSGEARDEAGRRVLVLRTFKELSADIVVLTAIAAALESRGRIVLVGDGQDETALAASWDRVFDPTRAFDDSVEYVHSTSEDWATTVLSEMCVADTIVLHLSPKGLWFPHVFRPPDLQQRFPRQALATLQQSASPAEQEAAQQALAAFEEERLRALRTTPLAALSTGAGLLREISYLIKLNLLDRTIAVADNRYYPHICHRVSSALLGSAEAFTVEGSFASLRVTALEQQLAHLRGVRGVTFSGPADTTSVARNFAAALRTELDSLFRTFPTLSQEARRKAVADLPVGRSDSPRRLPPDDELKVIRYTTVEDLVFIPTGDIVEVAREDIRAILSADAADAGCPKCGAPLSEIFFYVTGLQHQHQSLRDAAVLQQAWPNGKCQRCGRKCTPWEDGTLAPW